MSEERSRQSRGTPSGRERAHALDKVSTRASGRPAPSKRPATREERISIRCEIDGLPVELERSELGSAGAFVISTQPHQVDSEVAIFLRIAEQRFEMTGHVVQSVSCEQAAKIGRMPGYALLFTNMPEGERKRISNALQSGRSSLKPRASPPPKAAADAEASPPLSASQPAKASAAPARAPARPLPKPDAASCDPAELKLLEQLKQELAQVAHRTPWVLLGVSQGANAAQAKTAFFQASKRYHPHLYARYAHPEIKRVVTELFIAHKRAFTIMTKLSKKH